MSEEFKFENVEYGTDAQWRAAIDWMAYEMGLGSDIRRIKPSISDDDARELATTIAVAVRNCGYYILVGEVTEEMRTSRVAPPMACFYPKRTVYLEGA